MKVKVIMSESTSTVEIKINNFIQQGNIEIVDIKWSVSDKKYAALIMYK